MPMRSKSLTFPLLILSLAAIPLAAQTAVKSAHGDISNAQGTKIGTAKFTPTANGVKVTVNVSQLTPGEHGVHIHNVGKCEGPAFTSAGGHFNPSSAHHGANSLFHDGGTSLVIHAKADDLKSDPSGNSGDRIACAVIEK